MMKKYIFCFSVFLFSIVNIQVLKAQYKPIEMDSALRYGVLGNGLTYYIRHNDVVKDRADFYIVQNVGSILEEDNQDGLAHFLEHMAFNGTKNFPDKQIINYLETIGVKFGNNINAYTSLDETVYNLTSVPTFRSGIVDTALLILHDWSGFITLQGEEIDKERGVIREEWRTRSNADRRLWSKSLPLIYPNSQYAKRDVIGDTAVINNFDYETLRRFYNKWYRPDLQAVIIVGDINVDSVENKIKILFADIPKRENPTPRPIYRLQENKEPIFAILTDPEAKTTRIRIDYKHEPLSDWKKASMDGYITMIANSLIENMINNRLNEILQQPDASFAAGFASYQELVKSKDAFILLAIPHEGKEKTAISDLFQEAERMKRFGFTQGELDRAKADMLSAYQKAYNERNKTKNNSYVKEYIGNFLDFEPVPGIEWEYGTVKDILPVISLSEINKFAQKYIRDEEQVILITAPEKEQELLPSESEVLNMITEIKNKEILPYKDNAPDKPLINKIPKKGKIKSIKKNTDLGFVEWTLTNGMKVILKSTDFKEDEILLYGYSEGGLSVLENQDDIPSAQLSPSIVQNNGLGDFDQIELSKILAGKIVNVRPSVGGYEESLSGSSSVKDFETLIQLIYLYFTGVRADENGYNVLINQYKTLLTNASLDPNTAFRDSIQVTSTGHNPRTMPFDLKQLEKVDQKKALEIFKSLFLNPADFTFFLIGNIDEAKIKPVILTYLGGIPSEKGKTTNWIDRGIRRPKGIVRNEFQKELKVDKSSNFVMYSGDMDFTLENRIVMSMIKDILNIRYLESLREEEGGTYGVSTRSGVSKIPVNEVSLQMVFDTDPKIQEKLIKLIHQEIDTILIYGPKEQDLKKVKENMKNKFDENQKENSWWLNSLISYYKDGEDLKKDYLRVVDEVTGNTIKNKLKLLIEQQNIIEVVMSPSKMK